METLKNFIPINRRLFEHHFWCEERNFSRFEAWIYLIKEARFEDTSVYDGNKVVPVKRGQLYVSIRHLASNFGWSTKKVLGFLSLLVSEKMIIKETAKETGQSVITICNYDIYNSELKNRKQGRKRVGNSKETISNKDNNINNIYPPIIPLTGDDANEEKNWRDDFKIYLSGLEKAYNCLIKDNSFLSERQKYHPNLNIHLSLEKAYKDYWATEVAWRKRKKTKSKELNWKATFCNALTQKVNQVYLQKSEQNECKPTEYV